MDYRPHIIRILHKAGPEGLQLRRLSRLVFNECNSFFEPIDPADVHTFVTRFVPSHITGKNPLFRRCSHGVYALCPLTPVLEAYIANHYHVVLSDEMEKEPFDLFHQKCDL